MNKRFEPDMYIRFFSKQREVDRIPISYLTKSLLSLQKVINLIALCAEETQLADNSRIPTKILNRDSLECYIPETGSYVIPLALSFPEDSSDIVSFVHTELRHLFRAIAEENLTKLKDLFPHKLVRDGLIRELKNMLPNARSKMLIELQSKTGSSVFQQRQSTLNFLREITQIRHNNQIDDSASNASEIEDTLIGTLIGIDFENKILTLRHPESSRQLSCKYPPEHESILTQSGDQLIQLIGKILYGENEVPNKILAINAIKSIDMTPIEISSFKSNGHTVTASRTVSLNPQLDDSKQYFVLADNKFDIHLVSTTRDELIDVLLDEFDVMWRYYACAKDANLTEGALSLKRKMLEVFRQL